MDPLSIAASVVGLLGATVKVTTVLDTFFRDLKDVPNVARRIIQEVSDISTCLAQLQAFLIGTRVGSRSRTALIMVEQVVVVLTSCVMTFSELEATLESLGNDTPKQFSKRIAWFRKESKLETLCQRLNSLKVSLNLLLTTLTCASVDQATSSVETLTDLVRQVLQTNQDLCLRIANLELSPGNQTIRSTTSLNENDKTDDASTIRLKRLASDPRPEASDDGMIEVMSFTFEQDLRHSKVYKRVWRRNSLASISSSSAPSFGWSCLSETSLANVSNISVISLPIAANELSNGEHYRDSSTPRKAFDSSTSRKAFNSSSIRARPSPAILPLNHRMSGQSSLEAKKKIAILGTSLSGKTTVYRQIQAMQGHEFSEGQREQYRATILENLTSASLMLSFRARDSGIELSAVAQKDLAALSPLHGMHRGITYSHDIVVRYVEAFRSLLRIPEIRRLMRLEDWQGLHDNVEFFSRRFDSLFVTDCTAADCDIFRARSEPTTRRQSYSFSISSTQYVITEHGGPYSEQFKAWDSSYPTADFILFTVALSGYCRNVPYNKKENQMLAAMDAFKDVSAATTHPIILLFTKNDIFEELLSTHLFTNYFPHYTGPLNSSDIRLYLGSRFQRLHTRSNTRLFIRVVNAAEPEMFRKVFEEIESRILKPWPESTAPVWSDGLSHLQQPWELENAAETLENPPDIAGRDQPLITDDDHDDDGSLNAYSDYDDDPPLNAYDDRNDDPLLNVSHDNDDNYSDTITGFRSAVDGSPLSLSLPSTSSALSPTS